MATAPKRRGCFGRSIVTVIIVLVLACLVCGVVAYIVAGPAIANVFNALTAPITASNDFMNAVIAKDFTKAYGMIHPSQQSSFGGSADGLQQLFTDKGWIPTTVKFTNVESNGDATVSGTGTFAGNEKYVYISLRQDGTTWKIIGLEISDNAPTATPPATP